MQPASPCHGRVSEGFHSRGVRNFEAVSTRHRNMVVTAVTGVRNLFTGYPEPVLGEL